jgi:hypothetical protein
METGAVKRRAALVDEDVCRSGLLLLLQPAQRPQFGAVERMRRGRSALLAGDVQCGAPEIEVFPAQFANFRGPKAMTRVHLQFPEFPAVKNNFPVTVLRIPCSVA